MTGSLDDVREFLTFQVLTVSVEVIESDEDESLANNDTHSQLQDLCGEHRPCTLLE